MNKKTAICGPYVGEIAEAYSDAELLAWLQNLPAHLEHARTTTRGHGGTRLHAVEAPWRGRTLSLMVKAQGPLSALKSWPARHVGTAAQRAWRVARHLAASGIGTPEPVAWLERWDGASSRESYLVTRRLEPVSSFRDALQHLLRHDPDAGRIMALLAPVASAVRALHDAGVLHRDLGNQNILLQQQPAGETRVYFVDLSRARITAGTPSLTERARDLDRLYLPTDLLRIFCQMYFDNLAPAKFISALRSARRLYALRDRSRRIRHPIREARVTREQGREPFYPLPRDTWMWDEKSAQPINTWASRQRNRLIPVGSHIAIAWQTTRALGPLWKSYRELRASAFSQPVGLAGRWGISVEPQQASWERERSLLPARAGLPVLIRLYRHKGASQWDFAVEAGRQLAAAGYPVAFALCQDRRAVAEPSLWTAFCQHVVPQAAPFAEWIEIGHAINRVKWGLWHVNDYRKLVEPLLDLKSRFPAVRLMGPAVIDFEFHFALAALAALPRGFQFDALSHHLYVDRRGAPENPQGVFASLEKFALGRALARTSPHSADRLIVSEVNWPLLGSGIYSPVGAPYNYSGLVVGAPNVSETDYARFMLRYLLQAACSGLVDRVYWWRLAAHGYGLVDDLAEPWQPRPAYRAWVRLLELLGDATFERNLPAADGAFIHLFRRPDGEQVAVGYAWRPPAVAEWPFDYQQAEDWEGRPLPGRPAGLGPDPIYFRGVSPSD